MAANLKYSSEQSEAAWRNFVPGSWQTRVNIREFIQRNYTPYEGDGAFLAGPTERTTGMWKKLQPLLAQEREKGILDVSQVPSGILAHAPGYIDKEREVIVGLQTDAPLKRAIMPFGGWRVVAASLEAYNYKPDEKVGEIFTKYRKTHNDGVFDAYTSEIRKARSSHVVTGLPDAYGRGRIIGDYRRVALYGVERLIKTKRAERAQVDDMCPTDEVIRVREELADQIRALQDAGQPFVRTLADTGPIMLFIGAAVLLTTVLVVLLVGYYLMRIPYDDLLGIALGATGNPAILVFSTRMAPTERPDIGYAMIFPSMVVPVVVFLLVCLRLAGLRGRRGHGPGGTGPGPGGTLG